MTRLCSVLLAGLRLLAIAMQTGYDAEAQAVQSSKAAVLPCDKLAVNYLAFINRLPRSDPGYGLMSPRPS